MTDEERTVIKAAQSLVAQWERVGAKMELASWAPKALYDAVVALRSAVPAPLEAQLEGKVRLEIDVDGYVDERGIQYLGKAVKQEDGTWQCLANVGGALCRVEVKFTPKRYEEGQKENPCP